MQNDSSISLFWKKTSDWLFDRQKILLLFTIVLLGAFGISAVYRTGISKKQRGDLPVFVRGAEAAVEGTNIYDAKTIRQWNYVYLPLLAVSLMPMVHAPMALTALLWYLLSAAALCASFRLAQNLFGDPKRGFEAALLAMILCLPSFLNTLTRGQLGVLTVFLGLLVFQLYDRRRDFLAGFLLAFAVILKTTPLAPLGLYFLIKREWKVVAGGIAGTACFLFLIPSLAVGWEKNWYYLLEWLRVMQESVSTKAHEGMLWAQLVTPMASDNQSLYAVLARMVFPDEASMIARPDHPLRLGVRLFSVGMLAPLIFLGLPGRNRISRSRLLTEFSLFAFWMTLASPVAEAHHFTVVLLMNLALLLRLQDPGMSSGRRRLELAALLGCGAAYLAGLISEPLAYIGLPFWGSAVLWFVLFAGLLEHPPALTPQKV